MRVADYPDQDLLALGLARQIASDLRAALHRRERAVLAVAPEAALAPIFDILGGHELDWSRVIVLPTNELWDPGGAVGAARSLIQNRLLTEMAAQARFEPLARSADDPREAARLAAATLDTLVPLDVIVLNVDGEGGIAGLYPKSDLLDEALRADAPSVLPVQANRSDPVLLTLTVPVLRKAFSLHLVAQGAQERRLIEHARTAEPRLFPVSAVLDVATVHWLA